MSALDLCSYLGLGAVGAVTVNLLLGMLMSLRYSPLRHWPHRHINIFLLHQWTAYAAIALTVTHPVVLLFLHTPRFRLFDILWPVDSPLQPKINLAGAGALYLLLLVFLSSLLRLRIGRRVWRSLHYLRFSGSHFDFPAQHPDRSAAEGWPSRFTGRRKGFCRGLYADRHCGNGRSLPIAWVGLSSVLEAHESQMMAIARCLRRL